MRTPSKYSVNWTAAVASRPSGSSARPGGAPWNCTLQSPSSGPSVSTATPSSPIGEETAAHRMAPILPRPNTQAVGRSADRLDMTHSAVLPNSGSEPYVRGAGPAGVATLESVPSPGSTRSHNLRAVLRHRGFRRLLGVRMLSHVGDGWFQAGLAGSVLFNPEKATNPLAIAVGFALLLLPYSLVGPYVGGFLDRWSRRSILFVANLLRALLVVPAALLIFNADESLAFLVLSFLIIGFNRFFVAGVSAAIPHVVEDRRLVTANSLATTMGSVCFAARPEHRVRRPDRVRPGQLPRLRADRVGGRGRLHRVGAAGPVVVRQGRPRSRPPAVRQPPRGARLVRPGDGRRGAAPRRPAGCGVRAARAERPAGAVRHPDAVGAADVPQPDGPRR